MKDILMPPKVFNTSPISKEICEILSKYPMSYWHFEKVIEEVRKDVAVYSVVNLPDLMPIDTMDVCDMYCNNFIDDSQ